MKFCNQCKKEINTKDDYCVNCGCNLDNKKSKAKRNILIIIGMLILVFLIGGILSAVLFFRGLGKFIEPIKDNIQKEETREENYSYIIKDLETKNLIPTNWTFVGYNYGWEGTFVDDDRKYYFYIDSEKYEQYLLNKSEYSDDFNFHVIKIENEPYTREYLYEKFNTDKITEQYLITIYNKAQYNSKGITYPRDYSDLLGEYFYYKENNQWKIEESVERG